eukprot:837547-Amphidinium_carterae.1
MPRTVVAWSDPDFARCPPTRRSMSPCALTFGWHCLHTSSTTQVPLSLSSGEAEYYAAVKAGSRLLGFIALMGDFGFKVSGRPNTDSAAAKGAASRR